MVLLPDSPAPERETHTFYLLSCWPTVIEYAELIHVNTIFCLNLITAFQYPFHRVDLVNSNEVFSERRKTSWVVLQEVPSD